MRKTLIAAVAVLACAVVVLAVLLVRSQSDAPGHQAAYYAVYLDNGQMFYGRLSGMYSAHPAMTDVYYVVRATDPKTNQPKNVLLKRGKEWHAPDRTYPNPRHIIMIEPVSPNSEVSRLIAQYATQSR